MHGPGEIRRSVSAAAVTQLGTDSAAFLSKEAPRFYGRAESKACRRRRNDMA